MKKGLVATMVVLLAVCGSLFLFHSRLPPPIIPVKATPASRSSGPTVTSPLAASSSGNVSSISPGALPPPNDLAARAGEVVPDTNPPPVLPPQTVLQNLHRAVHEFGQMFGGNPVGTNPEITVALTGRNAKGINFLRDEPGLTIDANGELVDPWGTPYFFHQISGSDMELHSAGPDRIMWTADDLVIK